MRKTDQASSFDRKFTFQDARVGKKDAAKRDDGARQEEGAINRGISLLAVCCLCLRLWIDWSIRHVGARQDDEGSFFFLAPYKYV
jgi:hypothetical protein